MEIYIATKLEDYGDGATNSVIAVEKSLDAANNSINEDIEKLFEDYDVLNKECVDYYDDNSVEVSYTDGEMKDYVYVSYKITTWNL